MAQIKRVTVSLEQMQSELRREIKMRQRYYPVWANQAHKKLTWKQAEERMSVMQELLDMVTTKIEQRDQAIKEQTPTLFD